MTRQRTLACVWCIASILLSKGILSGKEALFAPSAGQLPTDTGGDEKTAFSVDQEVEPGKNAVKIGIDEMLNVNGSMPDLAAVDRWYLACEEGKTPTLWFGNIFVTGEQEPAAATALATPAAATAPRGWKVKGTIGGQDVDLTVTPDESAGSPVSGAPAVVAPARGDPARIARLRAARMPAIKAPVMFDTTEADAILSALEVYPPDNPWNQVVETWPLHRDSARIIASIGSTKPLRYNPDMCFVLVPPDQPRVEVKIAGYPDESDKGLFPVPPNVPIEGWPVMFRQDPKTASRTLEDVQRDKLGQGGDRHGIVVDPINRMLYEFYQLRRVGGGWQAVQSSIFDLKSNALRPDGWTSADAAGLPVFPAVVRYDELRRGMVEHAMRVTVVRTRRAYVAPATHYASPHENPEYPRMGERLRLRLDYDVSGFSPEVQAILKGLKRHGMFVADNGIDWAISVAPDPRIPNLHEELRRVKGSAFEVVAAPK